MIAVACCCVPGPGNYTYDHVQRLQLQVAEHLKQPYQFFCLNNSLLPGWWCKIALFMPGRFTGRVLYLDLDVTIVGDLDEVIAYPALFAAARDPLYQGINSSVMVWDAGTQNHIFQKFTPAVMERMRGDQDWINKVSLPSKFPKDWFPSYKFDLERDLSKVSTNNKAILFTGKPKPWDI